MGRTWLANLCWIVASVVCTYLACEAAVTAWFHFTGRGNSEWFFEESGRTVHFDAVSGYRLTAVPSRWTRITNGVVEYVGTLYGNNQGYPQAHDFTARRERPGQRRIAVLGDSFTAARFLAVNWPDRAEQELKRDGHPLELLNFSVDGGGLANWWSVLTRLVGPQGYELDGVVFAVFDNDLYRRFLFAEDRGYTSHMYGRTPNWDRAGLPQTFDDARRFLRTAAGSHIVSRAEFDAVLRGERPASVPRPPLRPVIARLVWHLLLDYFRPAKLPDRWDAGQLDMMLDIRQFLQERNIPAAVVYMPGREGLLKGAPQLERAARDFSSRIGAEFWDGTEPFHRTQPRQIRSYFFPYDAHWNQTGSDLFADFMARRLEQFARQPASPSAPPQILQGNAQHHQ
jgi:hypothetical protein